DCPDRAPLNKPPRTPETLPGGSDSTHFTPTGPPRDRHHHRLRRPPDATGRNHRPGRIAVGTTGHRPIAEDRPDRAGAEPGVPVAPEGQTGAYPSRGRRRQDLLVFGAVLGVAEFGGGDEEVVVHFGPGEGLAELGDELALLEVAGQDLELL